MINEQYERWKDFALRMARTCYAAHRRPSGAWILEQVESFFVHDLDKDDIVTIENWDHSSDYPVGHPFYDYPRGYGRNGGPLVCDLVDTMIGEEAGGLRCAACRRSHWHDDDECRCREIEMIAYEQWQDQWGGPVRCCIRAGLDMACAPSAGVIGFTAGDIRRMYPEGVPDWVFPPGERLQYWLSDPPQFNGTFAELPDEAGVVL